MPRLARLFWIATIVFWCGLFIATHLPPGRVPVLPVSDKTEHLVSYGALALGLFTSITLVRRRRDAGGRAQVAIGVLAICLAYGAIDEWTQIPVGRSCELADWYADAAGAGTMMVVATLASQALAGDSVRGD